jgi:hypothetical protein
MATCTSRGYTKLDRRDRIHISWPVTGVADTDTADISLEGGAWWPMAIGVGEVEGYFAGPDFPTPGSAHPVPVTSHVEIRISNADISEIFDGGFIQLVP